MMGFFVLEIVVWGLGIRGDIPQFENHRRSGNGYSSYMDSAARIVAGFLVSVACLALALWLAVWLAIRFL